jgi:hypothetical protein
MTTKEHRKHHRFDSLNLLHYLCLDRENQSVGQGMGRTLNVSESGIRLETHVPLDTDLVVSLTIGLEDDTVSIRGNVVHVEPKAEGCFEAGIQFFDIEKNALATLKKYIAAFAAAQR